MRTRIIGAVLALLLAVVGTAFLVSYVNTADKRAFGGAELVDAYFVSEQIPAGTNGDAVKDFLEIRRIPAAALSEDRVKDLADISGKVASVDLLPGEQL
ncbi:MAG: pilus assembly protein CpaB, partial [Agromyces sp.]